MKIYKLEYSYDMYIDGRMAEGVHLFSTLDKLFQFAELDYGKRREDFTDNGNGNYYAENNVGEWDTECWCISEVILDEDLEKALAERSDIYEDHKRNGTRVLS